MSVSRKTLIVLAFGLVIALASVACLSFEHKDTKGDPSQFSATSEGVNLLPSLDTSCGGVNCIR